MAELVTLETEKDRAERYKTAIVGALRPALDLIDEAKRHGLLIEFQLGLDPYGRAVVNNCAVVKRY